MSSLCSTSLITEITALIFWTFGGCMSEKDQPSPHIKYIPNMISFFFPFLWSYLTGYKQNPLIVFTFFFAFYLSSQEEKLDGENRYFCESCQSKQSATRRIRLHSLPPTLNLQLMRFIFDRWVVILLRILTFMLLWEIDVQNNSR